MVDVTLSICSDVDFFLEYKILLLEDTQNSHFLRKNTFLSPMLLYKIRKFILLRKLCFCLGRREIASHVHYFSIYFWPKVILTVYRIRNCVFLVKCLYQRRSKIFQN